MSGPAAAGRARGIVLLVALAAGVAATLSLVRDATRERIAANEAARVLASLEAVLPAGGFDNAPHLDRVTTTDPALAGGTAVPLYRARRDGEAVAAVLTVVAPDGYVDAIRLLVGVGADGRIVGVRAVAHQETPGLGDAIEAARSDWILGFDGAAAGRTRFALTRDGGDFDRLTGATVTSRAVVRAVGRALDYFAARRDDIFDAPTGATLDGAP